MGHRVVVRRRLSPGAGHQDGRPRFTDILGVLVALDERGLVLRGEDGTEHIVALDEVEAGKRVPPRPPRYSEMIALELVGNRAWPAPEQELLGAWRLRAAAGWTNRANSALPAGDAGVPLDEAAATVRRWYAERGLPPKITVPLPVRRDVADHLAATGWTAQPTVLVQTAELEVSEPAVPVELRGTPSDDFLAIIGARKASLPPVAHEVMLGPPAVRFAEIRDGRDHPADRGGGDLLAITRGAVVDGWLHLALVEVVPAARRRGLARAAAAALASWAAGEGATRAFLQVEEENRPAVALYARQGFRTHHTYVTYRFDG